MKVDNGSPVNAMNEDNQAEDPMSDSEEEIADECICILYQLQATESPTPIPFKYTTIRLTPELSVLDVKNELSLLWNIPIEYLKIKVGDVELSDDNKKIQDYQNDITFTQLVPHLRIESSLPIGSMDVVDVSEDTETEESNLYYRRPNFRTTSQNYNDDEDIDYGERPSSGLVGLKNQGATCYLNSLVQTLYFTPEFRRMIYKYQSPFEKLFAEKEVAKKDILYQMQLLFSRMQYSNVSSVGTSGLTTSFGWDNNQIFVQHDVQELNRVLCDKLEERMKINLKEGEMSVDKLYKGIMVNLIKCVYCGTIRSREEDFYDVSLTIKGKKTILDSLEEFTEIETLKDDNAYFCEKCAAKQTAEKSIKFKNLPKILTLQLKRFEYDWQHDQRVKLNDEIGFPAVLNCTPYLALLNNNNNNNNEENNTSNDVTNNNNNDKEQDKIMKEGEEEEIEKPVYDLYAILVHSGSAAFGHYYAFIRNFTDGKWYKFNDEHVTEVTDDDVRSHNWLNLKSGDNFSSNNVTTFTSTSAWSHSMQRSATPYMLVYRRRPIEEINDEETFLQSKIENEEIPNEILKKLEEEQSKRQERHLQKQKELNICNIIVHRNRLDLPAKRIKCERSITLEEFKEEVKKAISNEQKDNEEEIHIRFRRIATRKNNTKRPMQLYKTSDYTKTLSDLGIDKKQHIYLEQDNLPDFHGLNDFDDNHLFLSIRVWNNELSKPTTIKDIIVHKSTTLGQLKQLICDNYLTNLTPNDLLAVEEETEKNINMMHDDNQMLSKYSIVSGDIIHLEPLSSSHFTENAISNNKPSVSLTERYFAERHNEVVLDLVENETSFNRRTGVNKSKDNNNTNNNDSTPINTNETNNNNINNNNIVIEGLKDEYKNTKITLKISANKKHTYRLFKEIITILIGVNPNYYRIYAKENTYNNNDGKLLKDLDGKLGKMLEKTNSMTTDLSLELLDHEEHLKKGDKFLRIRYHNTTGELIRVFEKVQINKSCTFRDLKKKLKEMTDVPEELQFLSEWYSDHYYRMFINENEIIGNARIRKNDLLRLDVVPNVSLNLIENYAGQNTNLAWQLVNYLQWETQPYGKKEMQTTMPVLFTISENASFFDLRSEVSKKVGVPLQNLNLAFANSFPIYEGYINPIRALVQKNLTETVEETAVDPTAVDPNVVTDVDILYRNLAAKENRDGKTFNFKAERTVLLKKLQFRQLEILCWEDLRQPLEKKPVSHPNARGQSQKTKKNRDAEGIKIN